MVHGVGVEVVVAVCDGSSYGWQGALGAQVPHWRSAAGGVALAEGQWLMSD